MQTIVFTTESEEKNEGLQKSLGINFQYFRENKIEPKEFYGIVWAVIFAMIGGYLQSKGWNFLSWIFFGLSGMSVLHIFRSSI